MQQITPFNVKKTKNSLVSLCYKRKDSERLPNKQKVIEFNYRRLIVAVLNCGEKKSDAFDAFFYNLGGHMKSMLLDKVANECQNFEIQILALNYKNKQKDIKKESSLLYEQYINQRLVSKNRNDYYTQKTLRHFTNNIKDGLTKELFLTKLSNDCSAISMSTKIKRPFEEIINNDILSSIKRSSTILLSELSLSSNSLTHANQLENYILLKFPTKNCYQTEEVNSKIRKQIKCFLSNYFENQKVTNKLGILNHLAVSLDHDIQDTANELIEKINNKLLN